MVLPAITFLAGGLIGSIVGIFLVPQSVAGLDALIGIVAPAFAGSGTGASLGVFTGITGGIVGGLVGVLFAVLPFGIIFIHTPLPAIAAKILTAIILSSILATSFPH